jgi:TatA/E family protein of Tat protein translocase
MFGLGMGELLLILAIALLFFGPSKLPALATGLGKAIRSFKKASNGVTEQLGINGDDQK